MRCNDVIGILASDIHLTLKAPLARRTEPDWLAAQNRPLREIANLAAKHKCYPFYAGDIFDRWNSPAELINWAIRWLPFGYSIAGQHDLPHHRLEDIHKSAYWTLKESGKLHHLSLNAKPTDNLEVSGFSWGVKIQNAPRYQVDGVVYLALIHKYIWWGKSYKNAPADEQASVYSKKLSSYTTALFGDNHTHISWNRTRQRGGVAIYNPGSLMRRHIDQRDHEPQVGLLHADGSISPYYLDTSQDKFVESMSAEDESLIGTFRVFTEELARLDDTDDLDFGVAVRRAANRMDKPARMIIMRAFESVTGK